MNKNLEIFKHMMLQCDYEVKLKTKDLKVSKKISDKVKSRIIDLKSQRLSIRKIVQALDDEGVQLSKTSVQNVCKSVQSQNVQRTSVQPMSTSKNVQCADSKCTSVRDKDPHFIGLIDEEVPLMVAGWTDASLNYCINKLIALRMSRNIISYNEPTENSQDMQEFMKEFAG
jgi:hypothetical protein